MRMDVGITFISALLHTKCNLQFGQRKSKVKTNALITAQTISNFSLVKNP